MDDLGVVLFDNRRGTCHCLMLNYWVRCGGLQAFLAQFGTAAQFLWDVTAAEAALGSAPANQMDEAPSSSGKSPLLLLCSPHDPMHGTLNMFAAPPLVSRCNNARDAEYNVLLSISNCNSSWAANSVVEITAAFCPLQVHAC